MAIQTSLLQLPQDCERLSRLLREASSWRSSPSSFFLSRVIWPFSLVTGFFCSLSSPSSPACFSCRPEMPCWMCSNSSLDSPASSHTTSTPSLLPCTGHLPCHEGLASTDMPTHNRFIQYQYYSSRTTCTKWQIVKKACSCSWLGAATRAKSYAAPQYDLRRCKASSTWLHETYVVVSTGKILV